MLKSTSFAVNVLKLVFLVLVVALPLSTPITVWAGSNSNIFIVSAWKEILLALTMPVVLYILASEPKARVYLLRDRSVQLSLVLILLYLMMTIVGWRGLETIAGLAIGTRFLYVYLIARLVGCFDTDFWRVFARYLIAVAAVVALLGVLQVTILPRDFLAHFGYDLPGTDTAGIPPAYHLITGSELERAQSTLRGPNVLGAFLLLPILLVFGWSQTKKARSNKPLSYGLISLMGLAVLLSYARSAWLGLMIGTGVILMVGKRRWLRWQVIALVLIVTAGMGMIFVLRDSGLGRSILLHADPETGTSISNQGHLEASTQALRQIVDQPLGTGVGSAGPASTLTNKSDAKVAENYYLQVGQEIGILGAILFGWLTLYLGLHFYHYRLRTIALVMLASLGALTICNLLLHTWSEEAVAMTWWALAGLTYRTVIIKHNHHENK